MVGGSTRAEVIFFESAALIEHSAMRRTLPQYTALNRSK